MVLAIRARCVGVGVWRVNHITTTETDRVQITRLTDNARGHLTLTPRSRENRDGQCRVLACGWSATSRVAGVVLSRLVHGLYYACGDPR